MIRKIWVFLRHSWPGEFLRAFIPNSLVNLFWHLPMAALAAFYFGFPSRSLKVIGVTGTDGKTTTANLIHHLLDKAGKKAALISTLSAKIGQREIHTGFHVTSPHPFKLQGFLREIADLGFKYVVLEVTSHGLAQHRVWGIDFFVGVVTNVTREHLDYHQNYQDYLKTKAKLLEKSRIMVLNRDDESYSYLVARLKKHLVDGKKKRFLTYGIKKKANFTPKNFKFKTSLPGEYNRYNCLAAMAVASSIDIDKKTIKQAIVSFGGLKGRMEEINENQNFRVFVDFAHTPNALENTLRTLRSQITNDQLLITIFGSAGLRDRQKRPIMGEIAGKYADFIVLTAEDPRTEEVDEIINQIAMGCLKAGAKHLGGGRTDFLERHLRGSRVKQKKNQQFDANYKMPWSLWEVKREKRRPCRSSDSSEVSTEGPVFFKIPDRKKAIRFAIQKLAKKGDLVAILGKGHEESMCFGTTEHPWSDQGEARKALKNRRLKSASPKRR